MASLRPSYSAVGESSKRSSFHSPFDLSPQGGCYICREMFRNLLQAFVCGLLKNHGYCSSGDDW
jgi:hypothetical protein